MDFENVFFVRRQRLVLGGLALLLSGMAQGQTLDFGSCVRVNDSAERLACYDRAAGRPAAAAVPAAAPAASTASVAPATTAAAPVAVAAAATVSAAPVAAAPVAAASVAPGAAPAAAAADPLASFGAPPNARSADPLTATATAPKAAEAPLPAQLEAKVVSVRKHPRGEQVLTLENGQVWEQTEVRSEPQYVAGDKVVIRRGMMGSFLITLAKGSSTTRVRRIS